jgi:hypothetical protein
VTRIVTSLKQHIDKRDHNIQRHLTVCIYKSKFVPWEDIGSRKKNYTDSFANLRERAGEKVLLSTTNW